MEGEQILNRRSREEEPAKQSFMRKAIIIPEWSLSNWLTFLLERAPPPIFILLASGPCLTGINLIQGYVDVEKFIFSMLGELALLLLIRVMDDVKDYDKDVIVHPERPLPRGLIKLTEVVAAIRLSFAGLAAYSVLLGIFFNWTAALLFMAQVLYTYLMYVEFFCGETLEKSPIVYGLIHQFGIYIAAYFICCLGGASLYSLQPALIGCVAFSGFFTYEICRKLDPTLPLIKGTYLVVYGKWKTFIFTLGAVMVGFLGSYSLGLYHFLWPLELIMIVGMLMLTLFSREPGKLQEGEKKPRAHKIVEGLSILYLMVHMWSGYLARFL